MSTLTSFVHSPKTSFSIFSTDSGIVISLKFLQPQKAAFLITLSDDGKDILFTNVSFHQPDFPESLVNTWKGVKIDKNQFVIDYDYLPF